MSQDTEIEALCADIAKLKEELLLQNANNDADMAAKLAKARQLQEEELAALRTEMDKMRQQNEVLLAEIEADTQKLLTKMEQMKDAQIAEMKELLKECQAKAQREVAALQEQLEFFIPCALTLSPAGAARVPGPAHQ